MAASRRIPALLALMLWVASTFAQPVYRWTDENGRVMYGNQPPSKAQAKVVQDRIQSYSAPQIDRAAAPAARQPAATLQPVVMYATSWCPYCAKARAYFARNGIRYVEHDVEKDSAAHAEFKRLGGRGVPLIVHAGSVMRGFSEESFEAFIRR